MKRRSFLKKAGGVAAGIAVIPALANSSLLSQKDQILFPEAKLKESLKKHFNSMLKAEFNPDIMSPGGRYFFADSIDLEIVKDKTTVFDFADQIIEKSKEMKIDASCLLDGKIPDGITVFPGKIVFLQDGGLSAFRIPELKNYDAKVIVSNQISILSEALPSQWINLRKFEKEKVREVEIVEGYIENKLFRLWLTGRYEHYVRVKEVVPSLKMDYCSMQNHLASDNLRNLLLSDLYSQLFNE